MNYKHPVLYILGLLQVMLGACEEFKKPLSENLVIEFDANTLTGGNMQLLTEAYNLNSAEDKKQSWQKTTNYSKKNSIELILPEGYFEIKLTFTDLNSKKVYTTNFDDPECPTIISNIKSEKMEKIKVNACEVITMPQEKPLNLTLYGDSFSTDFLADTDANNKLSLSTGEKLATEFLNFNYLKATNLAEASKEKLYSKDGRLTYFSGDGQWSYKQRLNTLQIYPEIIYAPKYRQDTETGINGQIDANPYKSGLAPNKLTKIVIIDAGTDAICNHQSSYDFLEKLTRSLDELIINNLGVNIVILPPHNLGKISKAAEQNNSVPGFGGKQRTCTEIRNYFASCPILNSFSDSSQQYSDNFLIQMQEAVNNYSNKHQKKIIFLNELYTNTIFTKADLAIDCTHLSELGHRQRASLSWPSIRSLLH